MSEQGFPVFPGWRTVRLIGEGSFGIVYEIEKTVGGITEKRAMKVVSLPKRKSEIDELRSQGYDEQSISLRFSDQKERLEQEYSMMAKLRNCENVVYCDDIVSQHHEDGIGWDVMIRMELLTPLLVASKNGFSEDEIIKLGKDICSALSICRLKNIIHRDIKPQNIFVSDTGVYKLGDFGIARPISGTTPAQ